MVLHKLSFQQGTSRLSGGATLVEVSQSHQTLESAILLHIIRESLAGVQLFLQLETRVWHGDGSANGLQCVDGLHKLLPECGRMLVFLLFDCKHFAEGV